MRLMQTVSRAPKRVRQGLTIHELDSDLGDSTTGTGSSEDLDNLGELDSLLGGVPVRAVSIYPLSIELASGSPSAFPGPVAVACPHSARPRAQVAPPRVSLPRSSFLLLLR